MGKSMMWMKKDYIDRKYKGDLPFPFHCDHIDFAFCLGLIYTTILWFFVELNFFAAYYSIGNIVSNGQLT